MSLRPTDTVVSKAVIPRLQPPEQGSQMSPNKSTKVSWNQQAPYCMSSPSSYGIAGYELIKEALG